MSKHNSVYVAWRSLKNGSWHVVGQLTENSNNESCSFTFRYTYGALSCDDFIPFSGMQDLYRTYNSRELFPLFTNRLLSSKRPEYPVFIQWLGLDDDAGIIDILGRSGGLRGTDQLQMFQRVEFRKDGSFEHIFFAHGLRHLSEGAQSRVSCLKNGEQLYLSLDCQNPTDEDAVIIRAENPAQIVGYCPRYLANDFSSFLKKDADSIKVFVESTSQDAPINYHLMCRLEGKASQNKIDQYMRKKEFQAIEWDEDKQLVG